MTDDQFNKLPKFAQNEIKDLMRKLKHSEETISGLNNEQSKSSVSQLISYPNNIIYLDENKPIEFDLSGTVKVNGMNVPYHTNITVCIDTMKDMYGNVNPILCVHGTKNIQVCPRSANTIHITTEKV